MGNTTEATVLPDGPVTLKQYDELIAGSYFKDIEEFSDDFIRRVGPMIRTYNLRWVSDPLHQWSRQWEYPYIVRQAQKLKKDAIILDLGAGVSFLPYYLNRRVGIDRIIAVDNDRKLGGLYKKVNNTVEGHVAFQYGDMRRLSDIADGSIDFVYSVSVLEHTDAYPTALEEIRRILKNEGRLSLTFDISLDGLDDIPLQKAHELIACLERTFDAHIDFDLNRDIRRSDLVTSRLMAGKDRSLMPWKYPLVNVIKPLIKHRQLGSFFKNLTFCCVTVRKSG